MFRMVLLLESFRDEIRQWDPLCRNILAVVIQCGSVQVGLLIHQVDIRVVTFYLRLLLHFSSNLSNTVFDFVWVVRRMLGRFVANDHFGPAREKELIGFGHTKGRIAGVGMRSEIVRGGNGDIKILSAYTILLLHLLHHHVKRWLVLIWIFGWG